MTASETRKTFDQELKELQHDILDMGSVVEQMLQKCIEALVHGNTDLALQVEDMDDIVDRYNFTVEQKALKLLALQQPMARDLRTIAAAMKIITDVERAGDYAVDISKTVEKLADKPIFKPLEDIPRMAKVVQDMLREALQSYVSHDLNAIQQMIDHDDEVDNLNRKVYRELVSTVEQKPELTDQAVGLILIARYLERIADHITNIGERIYYMETGELKELHS